MFSSRDIIGFNIDELGDETSTVGGFQVVHVSIYASIRSVAFVDFAIMILLI